MQNLTSIETTSIILLVQDYERVSQSLQLLNFPLIEANTLAEVTLQLKDSTIGLVILDNIDDCEAIREVSPTPILMLTDDIDTALNAGADDCLTFHKKLLAKRVQTLINTNQFSDYDAIPAMIHSLDKTGRLLYVNKYWLATMGYRKDEVLGEPIISFMSETSQQVAPSIMKSFWENGSLPKIAIRFKKQTGEIIETLIDSTLINKEQNLTVLRDITELKQAETSLKASEARYRRLFKSATDAIFVIDVMTGKIIDASSQASWMLGYPLDELIGMSIDEIEADEINIQHETTFDTQASNQLIVETQYKHLDGHLIDVQINSRAIQEDGKLLLISFVRDISEHKKNLAEIEQQRNLAQALLDTANALNASNDLDTVLDTILKNVSRIMPHDSANIMMIEDDVAHIIRHFGYDEAGFTYEEILQIVLPLNKADNLRWVEKNKQPLKIDDTHNSIHFKWVNSTTSNHVHSLITAPIITNNEVVGFINVDSTSTNNFTEEQARQLMAFANQAAIAIQQASLVQKLQDYTDKLEKRVSERTRDLLRANKNLKNQIVQRQLIEEKLEEERSLLRTLIDNIPDSIYVKDRERRIILANRAAIRELAPNNQFDEIYLKTSQEIYQNGEAWIEEYDKQDRVLIANNEPIINHEFIPQLEDGQQQWLLFTKIPITDQQNKVTGFIGINRDITDLKMAQQQLSDERNMLRLIIDTIPDSIYVKDRDSKFILANEAAFQKIPQINSESELIGKTDADLYPKIGDRLHQQEQHIIETGEEQLNQSEIYYNSDGTVTHLLVTKLPLRDSKNNITGIIGVNHNISELRQAEAQLKQVLASARCLVWSATVIKSQTDEFVWDYKIENEEAAQNFLPMLGNSTNYTDAWLNSIPAEEQAKREFVFETHLNFNKMNYRLEYFLNFPNQQAFWLSEDVIIEKIDENRWHLVGVCTDITTRKQAENQLKNLNNELESRVAIRTQELTEEIVEREKAEEAERYQRVIAEAISTSVAKLSSSLDRIEIFDHLLSSIHNIVPYDASNIMLIEGEEVVVVHARGYEKEVLGIRYSIDAMSNFQKQHSQLEPFITNDVKNFAGWQDKDTITWVRSNLSVPISMDGSLIGLINLDSENLNHFTEEHSRWLMTFGEQAGIAIRNARYTAELEDRVRERTQDLEFEQAQLSAILNGMTDGVIYTNINREPQYINQALVDISGYSQDEWISGAAQAGMNIADKAHLTNVWSNILKWLETHDVWHGETTFKRKNGNHFDAGMVRTTIRNQSGKIIGIITVLRDISDEKRLQEQKARFISIAAHELRTPIANMKTRLFLMKRRPERLKEHLAVAESVVNLMQNLVEHMFDLSRFEHGTIELEHEPVNLQRLVAEVLQYQAPQAERQEIRINLEAPKDAVIVSADPFRLTQVIINLIGNALNYTPHQSEILVRIIPEKDDVIISFKDNGSGIAEEHIPNLFQPFYRATSDNKGAGLGLAIVYEIVKAHGGEINVESVLNEGTTFFLRLPREQASLTDV